MSDAEKDAPGCCTRCYGDFGWYGLHGVWESCPDCGTSDPAWNPESYDIGADDARVCYTHGTINVCRARAGCVWTSDPRRVEAVFGYQENRYDTWKLNDD